ncbi:MAG: diacylglycerol kinase family lipid kinase [Sphaerochaetaceae bacterium]|nr:diacylglycerol kinase family lipid kinase [Sphaerochaetaceae bacterium]
MKKRVLCVINPNSSKGKGSKYKESIEREFSLFNIETVFSFTAFKGHAIEIAREGALSGYDTIVCCGGDGAVNEVVNGIMLSKRPISLGIIPIGRGNDLAWSLNIPSNIKKAVSLIASGKTKSIDLGYLVGDECPEGRYFANGAGLGFEAIINSRASSYKHVSGMPSYFLGLVSSLIHLPSPYDLTIELETGKRRIKTQQMSFSNGRRMGSAFLLGPNAKMDDGLLDLSYANRCVHHLELLKLVIAFLRGRQLELDLMESERIKRIDICDASGGMLVQADGEEIGREMKRLSVEIVPCAINIFM